MTGMITMVGFARRWGCPWDPGAAGTWWRWFWLFCDDGDDDDDDDGDDGDDSDEHVVDGDDFDSVDDVGDDDDDADDDDDGDDDNADDNDNDTDDDDCGEHDDGVCDEGDCGDAAISPNFCNHYIVGWPSKSLSSFSHLNMFNFQATDKLLDTSPLPFFYWDSWWILPKDPIWFRGINQFEDATKKNQETISLETTCAELPTWFSLCWYCITFLGWV